MQEQDGSGTATANLSTGGLDETFTRTDAGGESAFLVDGLGGTQELADNSGTLETHYTYGPFGTTTASGATSANSGQFTGRENDGTGLYFDRARFYSPTLQRFLSEDPIGFAGGTNLLAYAANAPTNFLDPLGFKPCSGFGSCAGAGGGGGNGAGGGGAGAGGGAGGDGGSGNGSGGAGGKDDQAHDSCDGWYRAPGHPYVLGRAGSLIPEGSPFGRFLEDTFPASHAAATVHDRLVSGLTAQGVPDWLANVPSMPGTYLSEVINQVGQSVGHPVFGPTCH